MGDRVRQGLLTVIVAAGMLLVAPEARASSEGVNCTNEPTDMAISSGAVLVGADCVLGPAMDNDFFRFTGGAGQFYRLNVANLHGPGTMVVQVLDPDAVVVASTGALAMAPGTWRNFFFAAPKPGTYTAIPALVPTSMSADYGVTFERLAPAGADADPLSLDTIVSGELNPSTDIDIFRFEAQAGSRIRVSATPVNLPATQNLMMLVTDPAGGHPNYIEVPGNTPIFYDLNVAQTGTHVVALRGSNPNLDPFSYTVEIQCLQGPCSPPDCVVEVNPTFNAGTLTIGMHLGNRLPSATFNLSIVVSTQTVRLLSSPIPMIDPVIAFSLPVPGVPNIGRVAVMSTVTTPSLGVACIDTETVSTAP